MKPFLNRHRDIIVICLFAFTIRALLLLLAPQEGLSTYALGADGADYVNEARNILSGYGFSRETVAPFVPDAIRTPLYPLALAGAFALFGSFNALLWIQILLSSLIPAIAAWTASWVIGRRTIINGIALFFAVEPHLVYTTSFFASEGLAIFFLFFGIGMLVRFVYTGRISAILWSAAFLGVATLARPVTFYLPLLILPILYVVMRKKGNLDWKKPLMAFTVVFLLVLSPWLVRNYIHFGSASMGTVGWFNMYTRVAATTVAIDKGVDFYSAYYELLDELSVRGYVTHPPPVTEKEIQDPRFSPILKEETLRIIGEHPKAFASFLLTAPISVLTQDNALGILEIMTGIRPTRPPFSPTLYMSQHGFFEGVRALLPYVNGLYTYTYLARFFWGVLALLAILGAYVLWKKEHYFVSVFFFMFVCYIILFTLNAGAQIDARYRAQFLLCEVILASVAIEYILNSLQRRHG